MTERDAPFYELIDLESGNVASDFDDVEAALCAIRNAAAAQGWSAVGRYSLIRVIGDDQAVVATKDALVQLAKAQSIAMTTPTLGH